MFLKSMLEPTFPIEITQVCGNLRCWDHLQTPSLFHKKGWNGSSKWEFSLKIWKIDFIRHGMYFLLFSFMHFSGDHICCKHKIVKIWKKNINSHKPFALFKTYKNVCYTLHSRYVRVKLKCNWESVSYAQLPWPTIEF